MHSKAAWTETVLYYLLWAISTFLTLVDIWAVRLGVMSLAAMIVRAYPPRNKADNPAFVLEAVDMFTWFVLIAIGLGLTIFIEYRLRRAADTISEASGAPKDGGAQTMVRTALITWAWQLGVVLLGVAVRVLAR